MSYPILMLIHAFFPHIGYLTSANAESQSASQSIGGSFASDSSKRNVSGFKIMTVSRGYTEEADKLLDYLVSV